MGTLGIEQRGIDVVRGLAMDAPNAARSGHQGTAMALAPLGHVLWTRILRYDADDPSWPDRDRFVLSAGHASILLYSYLYLTGQGLELDDLRAFRRWGSLTPGHPEAGHTVGVEVTTGPLGQGFGNAVGMALAERWLRATFGAELCDHRTYVVCSDGDLMEGISHEAASFAGHQRLGRLVAIYDDNRITIDGPTSLTFSDDTAQRFRSYGWDVDVLDDAEDLDAIEAALRRAGAAEDRPSLIVLRSHIATPSPTFTDSHEAHGYALGDDAVAATKAVMGIPDEPFWVPEDVIEHYRAAGRRGAAARAAWQSRLETWDGDREAYDACLLGRPLEGFDEKLPQWAPGEAVATRTASEACLAALVDVVPGVVAGAGDLTSNTGVKIKGAEVMSPDAPAGRQVHFGVREHGMAAALVGMARHGGVVPIGATFFVFSDYMRPALRLAALSRTPAIFVFSHDSVGVGEDGPTHQPVEHLASLRAMPNLVVIRPADANETAWAWREALERRDGPTALVLTRQTVPTLVGSAERPDGVARGAYVLADASSHDPELVLIGTGSEVALCIDAAAILEAEDIATRVVSLPSWELFDAQDPAYQEWVLPPDLPVLAVEAGSTVGWDRWADDVVGIDRFGVSAPGGEVLRRLGFTAEVVAQRARELLDEAEADDEE